jgi:hypothetical protein
MGRLLAFLFLLEIVACGLEFCPWDYVWGLGKYFDYDMTKITAVVAIAWSTVTIPMTFLLEQSQQRCYGVRMIDVLYHGWGNWGAAAWILFLCFQPMFILLAVFHNFTLLFRCVAWVQIGCILLSFYLVGISLSREAVRNIIETQCEKICRISKEENLELEKALKSSAINKRTEIITKHLGMHKEMLKDQRWLLENMINNIDYSSPESVEMLKMILKQNVFNHVEGYLGSKIVYDLIGQMLQAADSTAVYNILCDIFWEINEASRKGILCGLLSDNCNAAYVRFKWLAASWDDHSDDEAGKEKIVRWGLLWAVHQQVYCLSYEERLANRRFVDWCKRHLKSDKTDGGMILESFIMFQLLTETNNLVRIIDNCIHICSE